MTVLGSSISYPSLNFLKTFKNNMSRRLVRQAVQSQVEAHEPWGTRIQVLGPEVLINPSLETHKESNNIRLQNDEILKYI